MPQAIERRKFKWLYRDNPDVGEGSIRYMVRAFGFSLDVYRFRGKLFPHKFLAQNWWRIWEQHRTGEYIAGYETMFFWRKDPVVGWYSVKKLRAHDEDGKSWYDRTKLILKTGKEVLEVDNVRLVQMVDRESRVRTLEVWKN